jgi:uncharacterized repeat protein (TIGR02543 family)
VNGNDGAQSQFASITSSGGLAAVANSAVGGTSGQGFLGGTGSGGTSPAGGGGGAGAAGSNLNGGAGLTSNISGSDVMYGSGGAGRNGSGFGTASSGGAVGPTVAIANRGGGGSDISPGWNAGAAGVVVIRYTNSFTVTFDSNGATSGAASTSSVSQTSLGSTVTLASRGTLVNGTLSFAGWNTQSNGKGLNLSASSTYTPTTNITLYAQWNSTISYNGNNKLVCIWFDENVIHFKPVVFIPLKSFWLRMFQII